MLDFRNLSIHIFTVAIIFSGSFSSKLEISPTRTQKNDSFCNYGGAKSIRFFPGLSADIGVCSGQDEECYNDSRILQLHAFNYTLWASLMVDATAAYPTGVLYGSRYHLGNFDGCMGAARKSPVGARYCLARLTYNDEQFRSANEIQSNTWIDWKDLDSNVDVRYMLQGLGQHPQEVSTKDVWMAVCVPKSCSADQVQQAMQQELQLWHPDLAAVDIPADMCTDAESSVSIGLVIYSLVTTGLIGIAVTATVWDFNGVAPSGRMRWIMYWSVPGRWRGLLTQEKPIRGVRLQPLAGVRIITLVLLAIAHHCMHVPRAPLLNNFITRKTFMDPIAASATQAYIFVYTMLFLSGLFLALGSRGSFFRSVILRYLRLSPSYLAVVAFYVMAFPSVGSGPLWKSMINPEAEGCTNLWWTNLLYLNNFIRPNSTHACVLQSWSLAADMQFFILGTLFLIAWKKWKKVSTGVLISAIVISMWIPFFTTLLGTREPIWRFTPSVLEDIWAWPLWDSYVSTEQWALPYLVGLCTGLFLEKSVKKGFKINVHTKMVVLSGAPGMMLLLMTSGIFWSYPDVDQHSIVAAFYATTIPAVWSICLALVSVAFALGPSTWLDEVLKSSFFTITSRLSYSIYLIHYGAQIAHVALMRAPRYITIISIVISSLEELLLILPLCLVMYLLIEAPVRELSKDLFKSKSTRPRFVLRVQPPTPNDAPQTKSTTTEKECNAYINTQISISE